MSDAETIPAPAGEGAPESAAPAAFEFPPEVLAGLSDELRSTIPTAETPTADTPEPEPEEEPVDIDEPTDEEPADDDAGEETAPDDDVAEWLDQLWENPRLIARIPQKRLAEVHEAERNRWTDTTTRAIQNTHETAFQLGYQRARLEQQVASIDRLQQGGDYDGAHEELQKFPGGERNYYLLKAELQPVPDESPQHFAKLGTDEAAKAIAETPAIEQALRANFEARKYPANLDGYRLLLMDIGTLRARGVAGTTKDPAGQALAQRRAAAETRKAAPKVDVSTGSSAPHRITAEEIKRMAPDKVAELLRDPVKAKEVQEAMAGTAR